MTTIATTSGIDQLQATPIADLGGLWQVAFRSANAGMCHQLYGNGRLLDWTDTTQARSFLVDAQDAPCEVVVAAVRADRRATDMSDLLPETSPELGWTYRARATRSTAFPAGARLTLVRPGTL